MHSEILVTTNGDTAHRNARMHRARAKSVD
jgi:hypothetical protein